MQKRAYRIIFNLSALSFLLTNTEAHQLFLQVTGNFTLYEVKSARRTTVTHCCMPISIYFIEYAANMLGFQTHDPCISFQTWYSLSKMDQLTQQFKAGLEIDNDRQSNP